MKRFTLLISLLLQIFYITAASAKVPVCTLTATANAGTINCNGGTATVNVAAYGGTAPYTGTGSFTVSAGTYTYTVTDAGGCSATASVTITQPDALNASGTTAGIMCAGGTATITVTATGGTTPYSGTGDFVRGAGPQTFTIWDMNGCSAATTVTIAEPAPLNAGATAGSIACNGGTTTVTVTATGGTAPYTGTGTFTVSSGTHNYTITDANGCSTTTSIYVGQPDPVSVGHCGCDWVTCHGGTYIKNINAWGGTAPYTGTGNFTLSAGVYTFTVTDANGCVGSAVDTIFEPAELLATVTAGTIACSGGSATVTIGATGGNVPYSGTGSYTLPAGSYSYTIYDNKGCSTTANVNLSQPAPLTASANAGPTSCSGNAVVTVAGAGGTAPFTGTGTYTVTPGTYNYTITDANGCTASASVTVTVNTNPAPAIAVTAGTIACNGGTTTVNISATGGTAPYTGTGTFTVTAGTYTYTITDANGCTAGTSVTVNEPAPLLAASSAATTSCSGAGTVSVTASGGTTPYTGTGTYTVTPGTYNYLITDGNGCTANTSVTVSPISPITPNAVAGTIACNGGTTTVNVTAAGGTAPYTGTGTFTVATGTHNYTITDANGCTANTSVTVSEPATLAASSSASSAGCTGSAVVTVAATGGASPYSGTGTYTVSAGTYNYTVTDGNGCTSSTSITVSPVPTLSITATAGSILCSGGTTTVNVTATGGTVPYTGTGTYTVTAGAHNYTVTDAGGCTATTSINISQPAAVNVTATAGIIATSGGTTTVVVSATGGTSPYTGTGTYTVAAGTYTYTVTDANGCTGTATVTVNNPTPLNVVSILTPAAGISCYGGTATVNVTATGGNPPYTGTGTYTVTAGSYTYTVTDANGLTGTTTINVTQPAAIVPVAATGNILCNGGTTTVNISATGGTAPYTGIGTYTVTAGSYTYAITDANGCTASVPATLTQPAPLNATSAVTAEILCHDGSGVVTVAASGGTMPYAAIGSYTVTAGSYNYTVTDANGCNANTSVGISEPLMLAATATAPAIACHGQTTIISVTATGGSTPYAGTGSFMVNAGTYNYTITDNNGCTSITSIAIAEPANLTVTPFTTPAGCGSEHNGSAYAIVNGGTAPYNYLWNTTAGGQANDTARNLPAGTYNVTITDSKGCTAMAALTVGGGSSDITVTPIAENLVCYNDFKGAVKVQVTGGVQPYTYGWSNGNTTPGITGLAAGTYSVTVTDKAGCSQTAEATLSQPDSMYTELVASKYPGGYAVSAYKMADGSVACTMGGGTAPYTYIWSTGGTTRDLQNLPAGRYALKVTDNNGCVVEANVMLDEPLPIDLPTAISPNGDGYNDFFVIHGIDNYPQNKLEIFNRWGNEVYSVNQYQNTWDGRNKKGESLPDGTYYVILRINGGEISKASFVEIRR
ncbi:MAG: gliding motility-associated C-terminal domain-containing protein [Bacteroidota bacterium]